MTMVDLDKKEVRGKNKDLREKRKKLICEGNNERGTKKKYEKIPQWITFFFNSRMCLLVGSYK